MEQEERITLRLRPQQLDDIAQALVCAAESSMEDVEILNSLDRVDRVAVNGLTEQHDRYLRLYHYLMHVMEEADL